MAPVPHVAVNTGSIGKTAWLTTRAFQRIARRTGQTIAAER